MFPSRAVFWKCTSKVVVGLILSLEANPSSAQPIPFLVPDLAWPGLSKDDIDRMHSAAARLYEGRSIGTVERWRSPDSRNAGEVKLTHSFVSHSMPCRTLDYTVRFESAKDSPNHYVVNWCKIPSGEWKIVELARPHS